jgi:hypothetical protein
MYKSEEMANVFSMVEKVMSIHSVEMNKIMEMWGVQTCVDMYNKCLNGPHSFSFDFQKIWMKMLKDNLESAIWLCVYNHTRLSMTSKDATKQADAALTEFRKNTNAL